MAVLGREIRSCLQPSAIRNGLIVLNDIQGYLVSSLFEIRSDEEFHLHADRDCLKRKIRQADRRYSFSQKSQSLTRTKAKIMIRDLSRRSGLG
jgi:hypothetical protein